MKTRIGRSMDAVLNPRRYPPFPGVTTRAMLNRAWQVNPMWVLANMAHAAYCAPEAMAVLFRGLGATTRFYASGDTPGPVMRGRQAFLAVWHERGILSFRGTEASERIRIQTPAGWQAAAQKFGWQLPDALDTFLLTDLLDDLNFIAVPYRQSHVHRGFLEATRALWPAIEEDLARLQKSSPRPIYVTGHSLGGAMAVIAGMTYAFEQIVTFGEPRVGQDIQRTITNAAGHIRYVNGHDPVPRIVPTMAPFNFKHHGEQRTIVDRDHGGPNVLYDHSIVNYAEILGEMTPPAY
ncbi:MAG: lipase family protein [Desulfobacterales bacterium]